MLEPEGRVREPPETNNRLMSQFQNVPFYPISASGSNSNPRNTSSIPVVRIFTFLDLGTKLNILKLALIKNVLDKTKRNLGSSPFTKILASMRSTDAKRDIMSANASLRACQTRKTKILTGGIHNVFRELKFED